jgi:hypothetical protein
MAELHFLSMEASNIENDVTIQFLVCRSVIVFVGIFQLSSSVQTLFRNFMLSKQVKNFFNFGGEYDPGNLFGNLDTRKDTSLRKSALTEALWFRWLFRFGL